MEQNPVETRPTEPRPLTGGQRFGIWVGFHGWLFGLVVATVPDTGAFLAPLLGGWALTIVLALLFEAVARRTRDTRVTLGSVVVVVGIILVYYSLAVEPALQTQPPILDRLEKLGSVTHVPVWIGGAIVAVGVAVLLRCATRRPSAA